MTDLKPESSKRSRPSSSAPQTYSHLYSSVILKGSQRLGARDRGIVKAEMRGHSETRLGFLEYGDRQPHTSYAHSKTPSEAHLSKEISQGPKDRNNGNCLQCSENS